MSEILEDIKDMGVLIGKGGVYGQVGGVTRELIFIPDQSISESNVSSSVWKLKPGPNWLMILKVLKTHSQSPGHNLTKTLMRT